MLSVKPNPITNAAHAAGYNLRQDGYYFKQSNEQTYTSWEGNGTKDLGLTGVVHEKVLRHVLDGKTPQGGALVKQEPDRRCGFEACFSVPKSVSMACLINKDEKLLEAVRSIPRLIVEKIQRDCAQVKRQVNSEVFFEKTNHLTCAVIEHITSRRHDPQLHYHLLFANLTKNNDGQWRALGSSTQKNDYGEVQGFFESLRCDLIYHGLYGRQRLLENAMDLGYNVERVGKNGLWELTCYSKEAREHFSRGSVEINEGMKALGGDPNDPKARDALNAILRQKCPKYRKSEHLPAQLQTWWTHRLTSNRLEYQPPDPTQTNVLDAQESLTADRCMEQAMSALSSYRTKMTYAELLKEAMIFGMGNVRWESLTRAASDAQKRGDLIPLKKTLSTLLTKTMLDSEKRLTRLTRALTKNASKQKNVQGLTTITKESLPNRLLNADESVTLVQYTTHPFDTYVDLQDSCAKQGEQLVILSRGSGQSTALREDLQARRGKQSDEVFFSWLKRAFSTMHQALDVRTINAYFQTEEQSKPDRIVVDRADLLTIEEMETLLKHTKENNVSLQLFAPKHTSLTYTAGFPLETLKQAGLPTLEVIDKVEKHITPTICAIKEKSERLEAMATMATQREHPCCLVMNNVALKTLTHNIREKLIEAGRLGEKSVNVETLQPHYLTKMKRKLATSYRQGQLCRSWSSSKQVFVDRIIEKVDKQNNQLFFEGAHPKVDLHKTTNFQVFHRKTLDIRQGEQLRVLAKSSALRLKAGTTIEILSLDSSNVKFRSSHRNEIQTVPLFDFYHAPIDYNYATLLTNADHRTHQTVLVDLPYYTSDKGRMDAIFAKVKYKQGECVLFTDDADKTQRRFATIPMRLTAMQTVLEAANQPTSLTIEKAIRLATDLLHQKADYGPLEKIMNMIIARMTSREAAFDPKMLVQETIGEGLLQKLCFSKEEVDHILQEKINKGEIIRGERLCTTAHMLALEESIIDTVNAGKGMCQPLSIGKSINNASKLPLTNDQRNCLKQLLESTDQFVCVQGFAGTGKTTILSVLQDNLPEHMQLKALAPTKPAAAELKKVNMPAQTLQSWLVEMKKTPEALNNTLLVLDESSMVGNENFAALTKMTKDNQGRLFITGARNQHPSVRSGKPYILLQDISKAETIVLKETVRPKNEVIKAIYKDLQDEKWEQAIGKVKQSNPQEHLEKTILKSGWLDLALESNDPYTHEKFSSAFVRIWLNLSANDREKACAIVPAHALRDSIHTKIREGFKQSGQLGKDDTLIQTLMTQRKTPEEMQAIKSYKKIDVIKMGGGYFNVDQSSMDEKAGVVEIINAEGEREPFFPEKVTKNTPLAFYTKKTLPMSIGERVRLTESETDKKRESATTYIVTDVNATHLFLKEVSAAGTNIQLEYARYSDQHIDYAYTGTSHHVEGATEKASFTAQPSIYKDLATTQALNINFTRAREQIIAVCDNTQAYLNVLHSGEKTSAMQAVGRGASDASINRLEQPLVSHYEQMFEQLFDRKARQPLTTIQKDGFLVHYHRDSQTLQWTNLETGQQGEGFLSCIQCKEKLTHEQMQSYAVIILANHQAKQHEVEKQQDKKINELEEINQSADHRSMESYAKPFTKEEGHFWGQDIEMEL